MHWYRAMKKKQRQQRSFFFLTFWVIKYLIVAVTHTHFHAFNSSLQLALNQSLQTEMIKSSLIISGVDCVQLKYFVFSLPGWAVLLAVNFHTSEIIKIVKFYFILTDNNRCYRQSNLSRTVSQTFLFGLSTCAVLKTISI